MKQDYSLLLKGFLHYFLNCVNSRKGKLYLARISYRMVANINKIYSNYLNMFQVLSAIHYLNIFSTTCYFFFLFTKFYLGLDKLIKSSQQCLTSLKEIHFISPTEISLEVQHLPFSEILMFSAGSE